MSLVVSSTCRIAATRLVHSNADFFAAFWVQVLSLVALYTVFAIARKETPSDAWEIRSFNMALASLSTTHSCSHLMTSRRDRVSGLSADTLFRISLLPST